MKIFHVATDGDVAAARASGRYACSTLESEGFIHCCSAEQLPGVVERYYQEEDELALLTVDVARLGVEIRDENTVGGVEMFPHVYGPIPLTAVVEITRFGPGSAARAAL